MAVNIYQTTRRHVPEDYSSSSVMIIDLKKSCDFWTIQIMKQNYQPPHSVCYTNVLSVS